MIVYIRNFNWGEIGVYGEKIIVIKKELWMINLKCVWIFVVFV